MKAQLPLVELILFFFSFSPVADGLDLCGKCADSQQSLVILGVGENMEGHCVGLFKGDNGL